MKRLNDIILRPIVTEKTVSFADSAKYVFEVNLDASKEQVANEVKSLFNVDPIHVNIVVLPGKKRRVWSTRKYTKDSNKKKAIVQLKEGQKIDLLPKEK